MKILIVISSICRAGGGVSEAVKQLAFELNTKADVSLEVITLITEHFEEDRKTWPPIPIHACKQYGPKNFGFSPSILNKVLKINPDIIHMHGIWMYHGFSVYLWHLITKKPYVITPHGMLEKWILKRSSILKKIVSFSYQNRLLKKSFAIQALTSKEVNDIKKTIYHTNIITIPNYVPTLQNLGNKPAWYKEEFSNKNIFLFFGRIHNKKGWRELLNAWDKLNHSKNTFTESSVLVFCGWLDSCPDFQNELEKSFNEFSNVIFAGPQYGSEKNATYYACNAFILPSKSEGLPMTVLEAWQTELVVIMTKECNLEIGFENNAAIEIMSNSKSISLGIEYFTKLSSLEKDLLKNNGKSLIHKEFASNILTEKFHTIYSEAIKND